MPHSPSRRTERPPRDGVRPTPPALAERLARTVLEGGGEAAPAVLDPACGEGALLEAAWRVAGSQGLDPTRLHGIESDPGRAERARRRLRRLLGGRAGAAAAANVRTADALDPATPWPPGTRVLANPPWVSFSGRQAGRLPAGLLAAYRRSYASMADWPSLHGAFLERIARHVAQGGEPASVLLPAAVCELVRYGALRAAVTAHARLLAPPTDLGEDAFPGVLEPAVLLRFGPRVDAAAPGGPTGTTTWSAAGPDTRADLRALEAFPRLPPTSFGDVGVHTGNAAALLLGAPGDGRAPVREGRDLAPYRLGPPRRGLRTDLEPAEGRRFRIAARARYEAVPILLRQTAERPRAALHDEPTYFRNSLLACTPPPELAPAFVVAVLNGPLVAAWHGLSFGDARQRTFPQVKVHHLRSVPFPIRRRAEAPDAHDRIAAAVLELSRGPEPRAEAIAHVERAVTRLYGLEAGRLRRLLAASATA